MNVSNNLRVIFAEEETTITNAEVSAGTGDVARMKEDAIDTISKSRLCLSKRDQIRDDKVRRLQHVHDFLSDETLMY